MSDGLPAALAGFDWSAYSPALRRTRLPADFGADSEPPRVDLSGIASIGPEALRKLASASRWNAGQMALPAFKPIELAGLLGRVPAQILDMPEQQFLDIKPPRILDGPGLI